MRSRRRSTAALGLTVLVAVALSGGAGVAQAQAFVNVQPQPTGPPGAEVDVVGLGFEAGLAVEVRWNDVQGEQLGTAAGPDFRVTVTVPASDEGLYSLVVLSRDANGLLASVASSAFLVTDPDSTPAPDTSPGPTVPPAGSMVEPTSVGTWAVVAGGLLALAAAVAWGRHRRPKPVAADQPG